MKSKMARKSLKTLLVTLTLSALLALPVAAATPAASRNGLGDAARIFETHGAVPLQAAKLSAKEMEDTEGAWAVYAARFGWGAVGGGVSYTMSNYGTDNWSWVNLGRSIGYGGVGGLVGWNSAASATIGAGTSSGLQRWGW